MREADRIKSLLNKLGKAWAKCPDLRLGQILEKVRSEYGDIFYLEDQELIKLIQIELKELDYYES